jgi:hypothetical protein
MISVQMNENEYKAYLLFLKSVKLMTEIKDKNVDETIQDYLNDPNFSDELKAGIEDAKAGRITTIDPEQLWENIR